MSKYISILVILIASVGCLSNAKKGDDLETILLNFGYTDLFLRLNDNNLNSVWEMTNAPQKLQSLVLDEEADMEARFLAAEILFYKSPEYPSKDIYAQLAKVYAQALATSEMGNLWGLPRYLDANPAKHFVRLGSDAIPLLVPLLDNERQILYSGSKEATYGNSYQYRVKDFAAFYIAHILELPYEVHVEPDKRDEAIEVLKGQLETLDR